MKLKATFNIPRVNLDKYKRALQTKLGEAIAEAAFQWLNATTSRVPVWSGASRATFQPLASAISLQLAISPVVSSRIPLGLSHGEGHIDMDGNNGKVSFTYATTLFYLIYNEFHNANLEYGFQLHQPGPYHFQQAGQEEFRHFAETVRLPDPFKSLSIKTIKVS